jgi:hypothetical protein
VLAGLGQLANAQELVARIGTAAIGSSLYRTSVDGGGTRAVHAVFLGDRRRALIRGDEHECRSKGCFSHGINLPYAPPVQIGPQGRHPLGVMHQKSGGAKSLTLTISPVDEAQLLGNAAQALLANA